jgi:hypothetical protein
MSRVKRFTLVFAVIGLVVPLAILLAKALSSTGFSPMWIFYVWPSYFILGGMAGGIDALTIAYLIVSILLNVALYAYVGSIVARLFRVSPGPTTDRS